ncbi:MAG: PD-(D/E)XK nuclease family protein [Candidatus Nanopelagicales bacterium]
MSSSTSAPPVPRSLSPSRASDFMTCPLLYRFRVVDRIPERPGAAAVRGTLVHAVLERLFDLPADRRTPESARDLLQPEWQRLREDDPSVVTVFHDDEVWQAHLDGTPAPDPDPDTLASWLAESEPLLATYFALEDPTRLEPAERELRVEVALDSGLVLRGFIDRVDVSPDGLVRVVDYKTGRSPSESFEQKALFQMRFYALVLWRMHGVVPRMLQLLYLGNGEVLRYQPDEADLRATERKLESLRAAIDRATETGDWRASPSRLCDWCDHRARCPAWGGTPPPLPPAAPPADLRADDFSPVADD